MPVGERVGEKHAETFFAGWRGTCLAQRKVDLDVRHRIGRHQKLKAIETRQQVAFDVTGPHSLVALELLEYLAN